MSDVEATWNGKPMDVLQRLIEKRCRIMGEYSKDAVVATAITALKSIRAETAKAHVTPSDIAVADTGWYGGFSARTKRPCFRRSPDPRSAHVFPQGRHVTKWLTKGLKPAEQHVYLVTPVHENKRPYFIVCRDEAVAAAYEMRAAKHRAKTTGNLAKNALGVAMNKISTRNTQISGSSICRNAASRLARVYYSGEGEQATLNIHDDLGYASRALKGGPSFVDVCLKRAANSVAGMLRKCGEHVLDDDLQTPFPEVRRQR